MQFIFSIFKKYFNDMQITFPKVKKRRIIRGKHNIHEQVSDRHFELID